MKKVLIIVFSVFAMLVSAGVRADPLPITAASFWFFDGGSNYGLSYTHDCIDVQSGVGTECVGMDAFCERWDISVSCLEDEPIFVNTGIDLESVDGIRMWFQSGISYSGWFTWFYDWDAGQVYTYRSPQGQKSNGLDWQKKQWDSGMSGWMYKATELSDINSWDYLDGMDYYMGLGYTGLPIGGWARIENPGTILMKIYTVEYWLVP
ncbi:MAG: hypothetical protein GY854_20465 [Deltaproteobacteria bacterium]|nr:hypothetical protein [Deltaproteobacteria bacterium]